MMKRLLTIALVLTMAFSFAACGSAPAKGETPTAAPATESPSKTPAETPGEEPVEITFWHSYSEGEEKIFTETVLTAFAEKYPNIKVNAIRMPYEGMDEQLVTAVSGDVAPDVMRMDLTWVSQMAKLGALEYLNGYDGFGEIAANALEGSLNTTLYNGKNYGLPLNANTTVAVYNNAVLTEYGFDAPPATMDELLAQSDVITLHCPLTPATQGIISRDTIARMKDGVIILNNGRGPLIAEEDLAQALADGKVFAAGLDVVSVEPIRGDNPLLKAPRCLITPHISWAAKEARTRLMHIAEDNLRAFVEGSPINVVSKKAGRA